MIETILNPNGFYEFEDYEVNWSLNEKEVTYEQLLKATKRNSDTICCSSNGHLTKAFGGVEFLFDFSAEIAQNDNQKFFIDFIFNAEPVNYLSEDDYEAEGLDYLSVAKEICNDLQRLGYIMENEDYYTDVSDYDGSRCEYFNASFNTAEEAFGHIKDFLSDSLRWLEAKSSLYAGLKERMDELV